MIFLMFVFYKNCFMFYYLQRLLCLTNLWKNYYSYLIFKVFVATFCTQIIRDFKNVQIQKCFIFHIISNVFYVNFMFCTHHHLFVFAWHEDQLIFIIEFFWSFCCCFAFCDAFQRRRIQLDFIQHRNDVITSSYIDYWYWMLWKNVNSSFYQFQNCIMKCDTQCELTENLMHFY